MLTNEINPFVRFSRKNETKFMPGFYVAKDHRIFYCVSGSGKVFVNDGQYDFKAGSVFYWPSGHCYKVVADSETTVITGCNFDFFQKYSNQLRPINPTEFINEDFKVLEKINFEDTNIFSSPFLLGGAYALERLFLEIAEEYDRKKIYYAQKCSSLLKEILIECIRMSEMNVSSKSESLAQEVLNYIRKNYSQNITNEKIGEFFNYHPNYLNSLVIKYTGKSMHKYLIEYRINSAIYLLQSQKISVSEAAQKVGISDIKHFSKLFKCVTGENPSKFKI